MAGKAWTRVERRWVGWLCTVLGTLAVAYFGGLAVGWIEDVHPNPRPFGVRLAVGVLVLGFGIALVRSTKTRS